MKNRDELTLAIRKDYLLGNHPGVGAYAELAKDQFSVSVDFIKKVLKNFDGPNSFKGDADSILIAEFARRRYAV